MPLALASNSVSLKRIKRSRLREAWMLESYTVNITEESNLTSCSS